MTSNTTKQEFFKRNEGTYRVEITNNFESKDVEAMYNFTSNLDLFRLAITNAIAIRYKAKATLDTEARRIVEIEIYKNGVVYLPYQLSEFFIDDLNFKSRSELYQKFSKLVFEYQEHVVRGHDFLNCDLDTTL